MQNLSNFKSNIAGNSFYKFKLSDTPYTREELFLGFNSFKNFMDKFKVSAFELSEIFDYLGILDTQLFDYSTLKNNFLVAENGICTERYIRDRLGGSKLVKTDYNVYVHEDSYVSLSLSKAANELVLRRFPFLGKEPFVKEIKRFDDSINELPTSLNTSVGKIDSWILFNNEISIGDLIKLYTDPSYKDSVIKTPIWTIYSDLDIIYFTIDENKGGHTVSIKIDDFVNGNWKSVEEKEVHSICLYDENGNLIEGKWFVGKQKDAPYFKGPIIEELKKVITGK